MDHWSWLYRSSKSSRHTVKLAVQSGAGSLLVAPFEPQRWAVDFVMISPETKASSSGVFQALNRVGAVDVAFDEVAV